jgi:phenylacetate-CoA ligase
MALGALRKLYGNTVVLRNLHGQRLIPYLPKEELFELRDRRLRKIIHYAAETVPYYQALFRSNEFTPDDIQTVADLDKLPLITKEMVRQNPSQFLSTSRKGRSSVHFVTSGSTGTPLHIYHDRDSTLANIAFGERERAVIAKLCGKSLSYKTAIILYSGSTTEKVQSLYHRWTFIPVRPGQSTFSVVDPVEVIIQRINQLEPDVVLGYGSYLEAFFRFLLLRNIPLHCPKAVIYVAEGMTPEARTMIEDRFSIPVLSQYNAVEAFKIGFTCEERNGFHLHEDLCHIKVINERGEKAAEGEKGEIVISNLVNHGTVLLNYCLGDVGRISGTGCACGRNLPILAEIDGRAEDVLFLSDGRFIHARAVWSVIKQIDGVLKYQLIQHEPKRFELRLVTADPASFTSIAGEIAAGLKTLLGETISIKSANYEELIPQGREKFRPVVSLCKPKGFECSKK